ncbi:MAG TPA: hypothetical protein VGM33_26900 [Baekduia sp.]|jgi:hypothetical protein
MHLRSLLLAGAAALIAALGTPVAAGAAAAPSTDLAPVTSDSSISAYGGWVVWSEQDPDGAWALVAWHDGAKVRLAAARRSVPFDADVGPGPDGRPTVLFSRCATEASGITQTPWAVSQGCRLRALDPATGVERAAGVPRPAGASDSTPSRWRGRIAFQRRIPGDAVSQVMVYDIKTHRTRTLRHGAVSHHCPFGDGCPKSIFAGEVGEMDLGAKNLAFSWLVTAPAVEGAGPGWEMRIDPLSGGAPVLVGSGYTSGACGGRAPLSPNATATGLWFLSQIAHCEDIEGLVTSASPTGALSTTHVPDGVAWRIARDGATVYAVLGPAHLEPASGLPPGSLRLVRLNGVAPQPTGDRAKEPFFE